MSALLHRLVAAVVPVDCAGQQTTLESSPICRESQAVVCVSVRQRLTSTYMSLLLPGAPGPSQKFKTISRTADSGSLRCSHRLKRKPDQERAGAAAGTVDWVLKVTTAPLGRAPFNRGFKHLTSTSKVLRNCERIVLEYWKT